MIRFDFCRGVGCLAVGLAAIGIRPVAGAESVPPFVPGFERFGRHETIDDAVAGRVLLSELSCTACHVADENQPNPNQPNQNATDRGGAEAIVAKGGPQLKSIARRVNEDWLRRYLASPPQVKPGTTMPDVLAGMDESSKREAIDGLVAFLSTQDAAFPELKAGGANPLEFEFWKKGDRINGQTLYHEVGCIACHAPDPDYEVREVAESPLDQLLDELDPEELEEMGLAAAARRVESVPLGNLVDKYSRRSLTRFLHDPAHFRPSARMPNLKLSVNEAADIASYLLAQSEFDDGGLKRSQDEKQIEHGKRSFVRFGCANCHSSGIAIPKEPAGETTVKAKPLGELDVTSFGKSCVSEQPGELPFFGLGDAQIVAITAAMNDASTNNSSSNNASIDSKKADPGQRVLETMVRMNCYACHQRDELGGVGRFRKGYFETFSAVDLGDEGRLPPPLNGVGRKLKRDWLRRVLKGDKGTTLRPHMTIRMPAFAHPDVVKLADLVAIADGVDVSSEKEVFGEIESIGQAGKSLMEVGCIQCHEFGGQAMPGVIGVDLARVTERLHPAWFRDFVRNPGAVKERTRMPNFFPDGKSQVPGVLGGDVDRQIASMWGYFKNQNRLGVPDKIAEQYAKNYELKPSEHPVILRTFMNGVGTHAIAVGFPAGTHYAFDAERSVLAIGWRERFIDARSTWFERMAPLVDPLSASVQRLEHAGVFGFLDGEATDPPLEATEFLGYRLDGDRVPTFRYRVGGYVVEDRIVPRGGDSLHRTLTLTRHVDSAAEEVVNRDASTGDKPNENDEEQGATLGFRLLDVPDAVDTEGDGSGSEPILAIPAESVLDDGAGLTVRLIRPRPSRVRSFELPDGTLRRMIPIDNSGGDGSPTTIEVIYQW